MPNPTASWNSQVETSRISRSWDDDTREWFQSQLETIQTELNQRWRTITMSVSGDPLVLVLPAGAVRLDVLGHHWRFILSGLTSAAKVQLGDWVIFDDTPGEPWKLEVDIKRVPMQDVINTYATISLSVAGGVDVTQDSSAVDWTQNQTITLTGDLLSIEYTQMVQI